MQISSASIALTLLKGGEPAPLPGATTAVISEAAGRPLVESPGSSDTYVRCIFDEPYMQMAIARGDRLAAANKGLSDGSRSPFDPETIAANGADIVWKQWVSDPRMQFEGCFMVSDRVAAGSKAPQHDADFPSRRDAMVNAYYFGTRLAEDARIAAADARRIAANPDKYLDASGRLYGAGAGGGTAGGDWRAAFDQETDMILFYRDDMEIRAASLANMFSFDSSSVTVPVYGGAFQGFSITHGTLGKIMDIDANGKVTLYDAEGKAWSAEDYEAANVEGGIPQMHNDLVKQADDRARLASMGMRREDSGRIVGL